MFDFAAPTVPGGISVGVEILAVAPPMSFARDTSTGWRSVCPICLTDAPSAKEHVPQKPLGGWVMTMTCSRCNNGLGSRLESELQDWFDHAMGRVHFSGPSVQGLS